MYLTSSLEYRRKHQKNLPLVLRAWEPFELGFRFFLQECFHTRSQRLCKFIGTKESVCISKDFNSHTFSHTGSEQQHGRRDVMWKLSISCHSFYSARGWSSDFPIKPAGLKWKRKLDWNRNLLGRIFISFYFATHYKRNNEEKNSEKA